MSHIAFQVSQRARHLQKLTAGLLVAGLLTLPVQAASVGAGWEPTPLVDPNALPVAPAITQPAQAAPQQPAVRLEEVLKPVLPFIEDVEKRLFIQPAPGTDLASRLSHLQTLLFGEQKYQDAGPLIAKMAELFPEEAAKTQQALMQQQAAQQQAAQKQAMAAEKKGGKKSGKDKSSVTLPVVAAPSAMTPYAMSAVQEPRGSQFGGGGPQIVSQQEVMPSQGWQGAPPQQVASSGSGMSFPSRYKMLNQQFGNGGSNSVDWNSFDKDWEDGFRGQSSASSSYMDDSRYNDTRDSDAGSTMKAVGSGLLSLAGVAGALAGGYYLNKKLGNNSPVTTGNGSRYYNPYYDNRYGVPYGYNYPYGNNYGYGIPYGNSYGNPYGYLPPGTYYNNYPGRVIQRPYTGMTGTPIGAMGRRTVLPF